VNGDRLVSSLVMAALLAGCAAPPQREPAPSAIQTPCDWSAPAEPGAPSDSAAWWESFGDSTLNALIREALRNNFDIKAAAARVDAAAAQARLAGADRLPAITAGGSGSRRRQNLIGIPIPGAPDVISTRSTSFGVSLDTSWELDLWGRVRAAKSAALAELEASRADLAALRLSIAGQTAKAWFALVESRQQVELAEETVESYRTSVRSVRDRYERGVATSLDLRLATLNLRSAEALLAARKQQHDAARRQLEVLLGRYPAASLQEPALLPDPLPPLPAGLPSDLLARRPDLAAAERRYAAALKRVSEARRAFFPRISLTGSAGTLSQELRDLVDGDFSVWSIAAGITQPLFQGGRLRANLALSHAAADQALAQYAKALLGAFAEAESAIYSEQTLAEREKKIALAAEQARAARKLAEEQYRSGLVDYLTVLETQRSELESRSQLLSARRERLDARVNLHLALGGGFDAGADWTRFLDFGESGTEDAVD